MKQAFASPWIVLITLLSSNLTCFKFSPVVLLDKNNGDFKSFTKTSWIATIAFQFCFYESFHSNPHSLSSLLDAISEVLSIANHSKSV